MKPVKPLVAAACLWLAACAPTPTAPEPVHTPLVFLLQEEQFDSRSCARPGQPCAQALLRYPVFTDGQPPALLAALQDWIDVQLSELPWLGRRAPSPQAAARAFIQDFEQYLAEFPGLTQDWFDRRRIEVLHQDERVVSLAFDRETYSGGAHPMSVRRLASFDRANGEILTLAYIVRPEAIPELGELLARRVRRDRDIPPDLDLAAAGFFVEDNRIPPTENFAVTARGLMFHYDPYEIAPFAKGPTEIVLSFRDIEHVAIPGSAATPPAAARHINPR